MRRGREDLLFCTASTGLRLPRWKGATELWQIPKPPKHGRREAPEAELTLPLIATPRRVRGLELSAGGVGLDSSLGTLWRARERLAVDAASAEMLPAGALVVVVVASSDAAGFTLAGDEKAVVAQTGGLEPVSSHDAAAQVGKYLESLPRGRAGHFGIRMPGCTSRLQFDQARLACRVAAVRIHAPLDFELRCAVAAAKWSPAQNGAWLADVAKRAMQGGVDIDEIAGSLADDVTRPQAAEQLTELPAGGLCPGLTAALELASEDAHAELILRAAAHVAERVARNPEYRKVLPCEYASIRKEKLHANDRGASIGFATHESFEQWKTRSEKHFVGLGGVVLGPEGQSTGEIKDQNLALLVKHLQDLDAEYVMTHLQLSFPPLSELMAALTPSIRESAGHYEAAWAKEDPRQQRVAAELIFDTPAKPLQREEDANVLALYRSAWRRVPALLVLCWQLARLFGVEPKVGVSIKKLKRSLKKVFEDDPQAFGRRDMRCIRDLLRASITFEMLPVLTASAQLLATGLRASASEAHRADFLRRLGLPSDVVALDFKLVGGKNRFAKPASGGYRDMLLLLDIGGHICELQLHYKPCVELKKSGGHRLFRWSRLVTESEILFVGEAEPHSDGWTRNGFGAERYLDGSLYVGQWQRGEWHGQGTAFYANGEIYQGEWNRGMKEGEGTYWHLEGMVYQGDFKANEYAGFGTYWYEDGTVAVEDRTHGRRAVFNKDLTRASLSIPKQKDRQVDTHEALETLGVEMPSSRVPSLHHIELPEELGTLVEQRKRAGEVKFAVRECLKNEGQARLRKLASGGGGTS